MSLDDFKIPVTDEFIQAVDKETITIFNRESTKNGSPLNHSFNLNYNTLSQAVLKVNLLADKGRILDFIPNEYKINLITINGKKFVPSDIRNSINIIEKGNVSISDHTLNYDGENEISIDFSAPIGAGVISPNAEISAFLTVIGDKNSIPNLPNSTQIIKDIQKTFKSIGDFSLPFLIIGAVIVVAIAFIIFKVKM